jgi:hypothetical protein
MRKKFTKGASTISSLISSTVQEQVEPVDTHKLSQTKQTLDIEISNHNHTKYQLSVKEAELTKHLKQYGKIVNEADNEHNTLTSSINNLTQELATEIDDHAQSEHALRKLEEQLESLQLDHNKQVKENKALKEALENSEELTERYRIITNATKQELCNSEIKLAKAANSDNGILNSKVKELEGTVTGKNRIISLLKDQAKISLREISDLRQKLDGVEMSEFKTPQLGTPPAPMNQSGTVSMINTMKSPTETVTGKTNTHAHKPESDTTESMKATDLNDNLPPILSTKPPLDSESSDSDSKHSDLDTSTPEYSTHLDPYHSFNPESFCNNCDKEIEDTDMELPSPIYQPEFIYECPSPWLHYGYCFSCLEMARFKSSERGQGSVILEHIAQCPGLLDQCWDGFHEDHIKHYTEKENDLAHKTSTQPSEQQNDTNDTVDVKQTSVHNHCACSDFFCTCSDMLHAHAPTPP